MPIFVPKQINVGFQNRAGTYTGKLAYIIYFDEKGKLRKETSWQGWRDKKIPNEIFDNEPTEGFVLNKEAGGISRSHWDSRKTYIRVYDPRGFEFEISVPNLLWILQNGDCIKGKGLDGEFVYGWDGTELVLVPIDSPDYKEIAEKNKVIHENTFVKAKDLVIGATYENLRGERYVYMGKYKPWDFDSRTYSRGLYDEEHGWVRSIFERQFWGTQVYSQAQKDKAEFFFIKITDEEVTETWWRERAVEPMRSVTKKFTKMVCDKNEKYLYYLDWLNHSRKISPYDYKHEKICDLPYENFEAVLIDLAEGSKYQRGYATFGVQCGKELRCESVYWSIEQKKYYLYETATEEYYRDGLFGVKYKDTRTIRRKKYYETASELYNEINPVYGISYLQNGYEYERMYYYDAE